MSSDPYLVALGIIGNGELTDDCLASVMKTLPLVIPGISDEALTAVRRQLESTIGVSMLAGKGLHGGSQEPWLADLKSRKNLWPYWDAYTKQLKATGLSKEVVRALDEDTDNILNECGCPENENEWRVQGLVMGDVQSGKTANYCGLINKAADAGYKVIVLLTGMIEELRSQSQERLDEGFVGRDSQKMLKGERENKAIGAGRFRSVIPNVLTSVESDFLAANGRAIAGMVLENIKEPVLLVMKKNSSPLSNFEKYLNLQLRPGKIQLDTPLLLIDDEADNASVNAKKDEDPARINAQIREILKKFRRATYVGYTATPFANVFINPDCEDLFPSNFVYGLNAPSNYVGVGSIFKEHGRHQFQLVDLLDSDEVFPYGHKKDLEIKDLPPSLLEAIGLFLISCAVRDFRKERLKHRTMLINVSRFTAVQTNLSYLVQEYVYDLIEEVKQYLADDDLWNLHKRLVELFEIWKKHYSECSCSWDQIRSILYSSIVPIKTVCINQKSDESSKLDYRKYKDTDKGRRLIVIGGLSLSRGLTLEGLCVSYFLRNSKAYDTLLQMGRWFGYRQGYDDLCRIWMDPDAQDWFSHIADVVDELRSDIWRMHAMHRQPGEFGMKVRSHPSSLIATAMNKMRNAQQVEISLSYSMFGAETPFLPREEAANRNNILTIRKLLQDLGVPKMLGTKCLWEGVDAEKIAGILRNIEISNMNMEFMEDLSGNERPIIAFIEKNRIKELRHWDICLPQGEGDCVPDLVVHSSNGTTFNIRPRKRQFEKGPKGATYYKLNKQRAGEIGDEKIGLEQSDIDAAVADWEQEKRSDPEKGNVVPGYAYRRYRKRPLLIINIIEPVSPKTGSRRIEKMLVKDKIESKTFVAIGLSMPAFDDSAEGGKVLYRLNKVAIRNLNMLPDEEDEDEE